MGISRCGNVANLVRTYKIINDYVGDLNFHNRMIF